MKPNGVAILCAAAYLGFRFVLYMSNMQHQVDFMVQAPFIPMYGLVFIGIIYVILQYRRTTPAYNWLDAFKLGGRVALLSALIASAGVFIYYRVIDTDYLEIVNTAFYNRRKAGGASEQELKKVLDFLQTVNTPFMRSTLLLSTITTLGLLSSLIISWLVRTMLQDRVK